MKKKIIFFQQNQILQKQKQKKIIAHLSADQQTSLKTEMNEWGGMKFSQWNKFMQAGTSETPSQLQLQADQQSNLR